MNLTLLTTAQWSRCQRFLIDHANSTYAAWGKTKDAKRYRKSKQLFKSPHHFGYRQPEWMFRMRDAMDRDDAEDALGIMHAVMSGNGQSIY